MVCSFFIKCKISVKIARCARGGVLRRGWARPWGEVGPREAPQHQGRPVLCACSWKVPARPSRRAPTATRTAGRAAARRPRHGSSWPGQRLTVMEVGEGSGAGPAGRRLQQSFPTNF